MFYIFLSYFAHKSAAPEPESLLLFHPCGQMRIKIPELFYYFHCAEVFRDFLSSFFFTLANIKGILISIKSPQKLWESRLSISGNLPS